MSETVKRGLLGVCTRCNGFHKSNECPKRLLIQGHYYRLLSVREFARRRRTALGKMNRDIDNAWRDLDYVSLWCPESNQMLPTSSMPIGGRQFVEAVKKS